MPTSNAINANSSGLVRYNGSGTFDGVTTTNHSLLVGAASNGITNLALTNGQLAIGNTGNDPSAATLTAGTGVSITNAAGAITINAVGAGLTWSVITSASQAMSVNNGYIANRAGTVAFSLPAVSAVGDLIAVTGINTALGWSITQGAGQQIFFGTSSTTVTTGSLASVNTRDTVFMVCVVANTSWNVICSVGNITVA